MFVWEPGDAGPPFGPLSYRAKQRWNKPERQTVLYSATKRAAKLFGGFPGHLKRAGLAHDVHLGGLYLRYLRDFPDDAKDWVSEQFLAPDRVHQVLPDAALVDENHSIRRVVEIIGSYPPKRLAALHSDCARRGIPYEFW